MFIYDEIDLEDFEYHPDSQIYTYPCPCGDQFIMTLIDLQNNEEYAKCPGCTLIVRVIYNMNDECFKPDTYS